MLVIKQLPNIWKPYRILALAPHTDDYELGAGGTIARLVEAGCEVRTINFSTAHDERLTEECWTAAKVFTIGRGSCFILDIQVDEFPDYRQDILQTMVDMRNEFHPDLVFCPSSFDIHQDHQVVYQEAVRAFKGTTILGWEQPWNNLEFRRQAIVALEERHFDKKWAALCCYKSQAHRPYMSDTVQTAIAAVNGAFVGAEYAEAFEVIRWVWK